MLGIRFFVLLVCSIALVESQIPFTNIDEYYALLNITSAFDRPVCDPLLQDCTNCLHWGARAGCFDGHLTGLQWGSFGLAGTISSYFGLLSQLQFLQLYQNAISGTIPSEFGLLTLLTNLNLAQNNLSGEIPSQIANIPDGLSCNVWFGNPDLICDPSYLAPGVTRCMGITGYEDYNGATDAPDCPALPTTSSTSSSPSTTSSPRSTTSSSPAPFNTENPPAPVVQGVATTSIAIGGLPHGSSSVLAIEVHYRRTGEDGYYTQDYASLTAGDYGLRNLLPCTWYNFYYKIKGPSGWGLGSPIIQIKTLGC